MLPTTIRKRMPLHRIDKGMRDTVSFKSLTGKRKERFLSIKLIALILKSRRSGPLTLKQRAKDETGWEI